MTMLGDYDIVVFVLNPGADGDCVQAFGLPFTFKFEHEDCIPFALDVTSEPTLQPTPEPTAQPTTTSAPTIAATEAPLQPAYPHQNVVIVGVSASFIRINILLVIARVRSSLLFYLLLLL